VRCTGTDFRFIYFNEIQIDPGDKILSYND
jgi:hypothetical protein